MASIRTPTSESNIFNRKGNKTSSTGDCACFNDGFPTTSPRMPTPGAPHLRTMPSKLNVITLRPEQPQDEDFLFELYASTRQAELDAWGWPPEMRRAFLSMQFKASQGRHLAVPAAEFQIVMVDGVNAGRLVVHRTGGELRVVDIGLLPQFRSLGIGTALLQRVRGEAAAAKTPVRLQVLKGNCAERLYQRLGFVKTGETDLHWEMEWRVPVASVD